MEQHFPYKTSKFFRKFKLSNKLILSFQGAQTWPFWYFRCALYISGILYVIAHNIKNF